MDYLQIWLEEGPRKYWIIDLDVPLEHSNESQFIQGLPLGSPHLSQVYESERARIINLQMAASRTTVEGGDSINKRPPRCDGHCGSPHTKEHGMTS